MNKGRFLGVILCWVVGTAGAQDRFEGLVEPVRDVLMGPPVSGRVSDLHVGEGAAVQQGDPILSLEDDIEALEVRRRQLVLDDRSELLAARQRRDLLKKDLDSTRSLFETTASVSREELDRKEVEYSLSVVEVGRAEQAERREEAELEIAKARMSQYHIHAPFSGVLAQVSVDAGESVQAGQPVLRLVDVSEAYLVLNIPAEVAQNLSVGEEGSLSFGPEAEDNVTGTVSFISPVIDPASGLRQVKFLFSNTGPQVEPGRVGFWLRGGASNE